MSQQQALDTAQAMETYKRWCSQQGKDYIAPDPSKTAVSLRKGKEVITLYAEKGYKLAILGIKKQVLSIIWCNWFTPRPRLSNKAKQSFTRYLDG